MLAEPSNTNEPEQAPAPADEPTDALEGLGAISEAGRLIGNAEIAYRLNWRWASFELYVISPTISPILPPVIIPPAPLTEGDGVEFVYPIFDFGYKLATSKAEEMLSAGMSMCKLYYTIEKMVDLLIQRLKTSGTDTDTEVQVSFEGFIQAQRKAFESIINLSYNVVVTNFEPGEWGEMYLQTIKRLADKGFGYPPEAPRDAYRHGPQSSGSSTRKP